MSRLSRLPVIPQLHTIGCLVCYPSLHNLHVCDCEIHIHTAPPIVTAESQSSVTLVEEGFKIVFTVTNDVPKISPNDTTWTFTSPLDGTTKLFDDSLDERFQFSGDKLTLTISSVSLLDAGLYTVRAFNPAGSDDDFTRVVVYGE